uniref:Uncharacterized protein n=1 Tax=Dunaliella tertiolecta TaxID=3047 RepID=A0A7S3R7Z5_DUNTE|mmetsp:Transcript_18509/g.51955  ORF Transcript_18509/g.51955 Transcript_18509/m.51955 type:complete len:403 (+) Transcript_18509:42-1250(+)
MLIHSANPAKPSPLAGSRPAAYLQKLPTYRLIHQKAHCVHGSSNRANAAFSTALRKQARWQILVASYAPGSEGNLQELRELEAERDEAVARAETCGKTSQKLENIIKLLEEMALQKIKNGDEDGARAVLVEKATVKEALASNAAKASANAMLVQKLAPIIAAKQQQLPTPPSEPSKKKAAMMWPPPPTFPSTSPPASSPPPPSYANSSAGAAEKAAAAAAAAAAAIARASSAPPAPSSSPSPPTPSFNSEPVYANPFPAQPAPGWDASSWAVAGAESSGATWPMPKWQQSLEEARARLQAEEEAARATGRTARLSAEESISQAKARMQMQAENDLQAGLQRVRQAQLQSTNSIEEARQRIQEQDRQVLALVQQIMARYRRGDYVPEDELEFAFQQLERRFTV